MYLDLTSISNITMDTLANLNIAIMSCIITCYKNIISEKYAKIIDSVLAKYAENIMILNIDNYYSIHTKWMSNMTITSIVTYLTIVLINLITTQNVISNTNIYNLIFVNAGLIKINVANKFIKLYGLSHN